MEQEDIVSLFKDNSFSTCAKLTKKNSICYPLISTCVCVIRTCAYHEEILVFREILRPYQINDPLHVKWNRFPETAIPTCVDLQNKKWLFVHILNNQLSALGAYSKTKSFGWALTSTEWTNKKCQTTKTFTKITKYPPKFHQKLITKILNFLLFKLAPSFS